MPLRFCKTRWLENVPVVDRAVEMLPQLRLYVNAVQENKALLLVHDIKLFCNNKYVVVI